MLRWKVAPGEYVEVLEHRLVAGIPAGPVHHLNRDRADNRARNLMPTASTSEHSTLHRALDYQAIAEAYQRGATTTAVAERFGTYSGNVSRILRQLGVKVRHDHPRRNRRADEHRDAIETELRLGRPITAVARAFGVGRGSVDRIRREAGIAARRPGRPGGIFWTPPGSVAAQGLGDPSPERQG